MYFVNVETMPNEFKTIYFTTNYFKAFDLANKIWNNEKYNIFGVYLHNAILNKIEDYFRW